MTKTIFDKCELAYGGENYANIVKKANGLIYTKYINRPIAWFFTQRLYFISPNAISMFAFLLLLSSLIIFNNVNSNREALILYVLVVLNYVLDSVDGQVARLTKRGSPLGEWLDHSLDAIRLILVNIFIINIILNSKVESVPIIVLFSCLVGQVGLYVVGLLREKILKLNISQEIKASSNYGKVIYFLLTPADYGVFITIFILSANPVLLAYIYVFFGIYNILLLIATMILIFRRASS